MHSNEIPPLHTQKQINFESLSPQQYDYNNLNIPWTEEQIHILKDIPEPSVDRVIIASAGSGKTQVLIECIVRILSPPISATPEQVLVMAFNNAAAAEIRKRLLLRLQKQSLIPAYMFQQILQSPTIGTTIHAFSKWICKKQNLIPKNSSHEFVIDEFPAILRNNLQTSPELVSGIDWVFIDEMQDVCEVQFGILQAFRRNHNSSVTVIGDPDQNLYKWRFTNSAFLNEFHSMAPLIWNNCQDKFQTNFENFVPPSLQNRQIKVFNIDHLNYPEIDYRIYSKHNTKIFTMTVNHRSGPGIVAYCQAILERNHAKDATPYSIHLRSYQSDLGYKGIAFNKKPQLIILESTFQSMEYIRKQVDFDVKYRGFKLHEIAILGRSNNLLYKFESWMEKCNIATYLAKGQEEGGFCSRDSGLEEIENALYLGTIHQAKGKQWRKVYGVGYHTTYFPDQREVDIRSERNLHFVLCSRPEEELVLVMDANHPSLLLIEIPLNLYEVTNLKEIYLKLWKEKLHTANKIKRQSQMSERSQNQNQKRQKLETTSTHIVRLQQSTLTNWIAQDNNRSNYEKPNQKSDQNQELDILDMDVTPPAFNLNEFPSEWMDLVNSELIVFETDDERKQRQSWYCGVSDLIQSMKGEAYLNLKNLNVISNILLQHLQSLDPNINFLTGQPWTSQTHSHVLLQSKKNISIVYPNWIRSKHLEAELGRFMDMLGRFMIWEFSCKKWTVEKTGAFIDKHVERCLFGDEKEKQKLPKDDVLRLKLLQHYKNLQHPQGKCWRQLIWALWSCSWCASFEKGRTAIAFQPHINESHLWEFREI